MRILVVLLVTLTAMCVIVGIALSIGEKQNSHGVPHAKFSSTMQQGESGVERHAQLRLLGWSFASLQVVFMVACLTLGVVGRGKHLWPFWVGGAVFVLLFTLLFVSDGMYARGESPQLVFSFPLPTALMLYGVSTIPLIFMGIYIAAFDSWILKPEDLERFRQLLKEKQTQQGKP